jgi:hypothetical protein
MSRNDTKLRISDETNDHDGPERQRAEAMARMASRGYRDALVEIHAKLLGQGMISSRGIGRIRGALHGAAFRLTFPAGRNRLRGGSRFRYVQVSLFARQSETFPCPF